MAESTVNAKGASVPGSEAGAPTSESKTTAKATASEDERDEEAYARAEAPLLREKATWGTYRGLLPFIAGLTCARVGLIGVTYGGYSMTDLGILTDGPMIVVVLVMLGFVIYLGRSRKKLSNDAAKRIALATFALEAISGWAFGAVNTAEPNAVWLLFAISVLCTGVGSLSILYWLRLGRGINAIVAGVYVFSALAISEVLLMMVAFLPHPWGTALAGLIALGQFPCLAATHAVDTPQSIPGRARRDDFFGLGSDIISRNRLMIAFAAGIGSLAVVIGILRGYPDGDPIPFRTSTRIAYMCVTIGISVIAIISLVKLRQQIMNVGAFIVLEVLAMLAILFYATMPDRLDVGALFTTSLNAMMVGFAWYITIAFMSVGKLEPYYYGLSGWVVWLGCRSIVRTASILVLAVHDDIITIAVASAFLVLSTQVVLCLVLNVTHHISERVLAQERMQFAETERKRNAALDRVFGLNDQAQTMADVREETMRRSAEEMGRQFMLSDREIEVLTLYALGHTQKRVAEELFISQGTAHAHIKRIYAKTNLHSRQELIDYLQKYTH